VELCQSAYANKLIEKAGMAGCNGCVMPMESKLKLSKRSTAPVVDATQYHSIIGSLLYLLHTRPDLTISVGFLSRFMEDPKEDHMEALKHLLRYIVATMEFSLQYARGEGELRLLGYSDSDLAADVDGRRSTTGVLFFLGGSPVTWLSKKHMAVAKSSCEAEYMASAAVAAQGTWLQRLLEEVTGIRVPRPIIRMDNTTAIALAKNPILHDRSKHIDVKFHYTKECVECGDVEQEHIGANEELVDTLTKALGTKRFHELQEKICIVRVSTIKK
jgi:hypothetical protein